MTWSFQIGKLFGIPLRIHVTFFLLLLLVAAPTQAMSGMGRVSGVLFVVALFACVIIHELAHSLMARKYGVPVRYIILLPIGGVAMMERMPDDPHQELNVAVVGPLASLAIAVVLSAIVFVMGGNVQTFLSPLHAGGASFVARLAWVNIMLAGFNILPAFPMDGGRVLRALLAFHMDYAAATHTAAIVGQTLAIVGGVFAFFTHEWFLVLIALFIYMGATSEDTQVRVRRTLREVPAWQAMVNDFRALDKDDTLAEAFQYAGHSYQHDFPVVDEGHLVGLVTRHALIAGMQEHGGDTTVAEVMVGDPCRVGPNDSLADVFQEISTGACPVAAVVDEGRMVGLVTPESVNQYLMALAYQRRPSV
ncbi:site-2 protease family protein [bacterium]|nr:site-2 protease family protein [bacterium]